MGWVTAMSGKPEWLYSNRKGVGDLWKKLDREKLQEKQAKKGAKMTKKDVRNDKVAVSGDMGLKESQHYAREFAIAVEKWRGRCRGEFEGRSVAEQKTTAGKPAPRNPGVRLVVAARRSKRLSLAYSTGETVS